ncbi:batten's disease protein Cln3 [Jaminaea rosea]|uniref:Protein BTN n=1 Tax=Jaminaea rosea TaxID=1569628 RepID=A0A316V2E7_9BASI|nr:batten's disease protein Cln3 [Jaminaea rosea]PWN30353.1 batten's disease protein Cln3 [Jaminaea rosea]
MSAREHRSQSFDRDDECEQGYQMASLGQSTAGSRTTSAANGYAVRGDARPQSSPSASPLSSSFSIFSILHPSPIALFSLSFFLLGLLNNALYVVILTSALELLPQGVPTGLVALANIGPALVAKAIWPYALKGRVRYARRVWACTALSTAGILVVALVPTLGARLVGISMASFSSGLGELTFLQLCTTYGVVRAGRGVGWFASGTGAAGLFGAGAWWVVRPLGVKGGLGLLSALPLFMAASYFLVLPSVEQLRDFETKAVFAARGGGYQAVPGGEAADDDDDDDDHGQEAGSDDGRQDTASGARPSTTIDSMHSSSAPTLTPLPRGLDETIPSEHKQVRLSFNDKLALLRPMLLPFILPLVLVYLAEYTINQGVAPTLLYPVPQPSRHLLLSWLIKKLSDYYPLYQLTYQAFVFLSRSSISLLGLPPIPKRLLWMPAFVQVGILGLLASESVYAWFRESLARSLCLVFVGIEGLAGGWAYVSVFYQIGTNQREAVTTSRGVDEEGVESEDDEVAQADLVRRGQEQEFRVGCVGVGDSLGILVASLVSMPLQLGLCDAQVSRGRDLCRQV